MKHTYFKNKFLALYVPSIAIITIIVAGCSGSAPKNGPSFLYTGSDIMEGPGLFTGEKGAFYVVGGEKKPKAQLVSDTPATKSIDDMDLDETSKVLDDKIKQLQRDQIELEILKRDINKKLQQ